MPRAYIAVDTGMRITEWNRAAERIFGWSAAEVIGGHAGFLVPEHARSHADSVWHKFLDEDRASYSINENLTSDGRVLICEWFQFTRPR